MSPTPPPVIPTDPYALVENGIADRLRAALWGTYFDKVWQVSNNDANINVGVEYLIVMRPGGFPFLQTNYKSGEIQDVDWVTYAHLYVRYQEKDEQWARFNPFRWAVMHVVMKYRFLDEKRIGDTTLAQVPNIDRVKSIDAAEDAGFWRFFGTKESSPPSFMYQPLRIITGARVRFE